MIVQRFLHWLETAPNSSRAEAAETLSRAMLTSSLAEQEREAAEAVLTNLLDDPSSKVRLVMADAIASHNQAPRHLIMALAKDQADIAMLVLCRSPLFLDSELEDIASNGEGFSLMAIACRHPLSSRVAAAIIGSGHLDACQALLQNPSVDLSAENLRALAARFGSNAEIRDLLLARPGLPADIRQMLIASLSSALQDFVVQRSWLAEARAKKVVQQARDHATARLAADVGGDEIPQLVRHLRQSGQLTAAFLLRAVCGGNILLFSAAVAELSGIPQSRILSVLQQGRTAAFRAIYDRAGLPSSAIAAITAAVDAWLEQADTETGQQDPQTRKQIITQIVDDYSNSAEKLDETLLALLQRILAEVTHEAALLRAREFADAA